MTTRFTRAQILGMLTEQYDPWEVDKAVRMIGGWVERGDGCAVYRNEELGHPELGLLKFVSYGSPAAQIEQPEPPTRLPDIGGDINWRYVLVGTYREED